jgi:hypothetical protein
MKPEDFIHMPIPASMFTAVCALLGSGATIVALGPLPSEPVKQDTALVSDGPETFGQESPVSDGNGPSATNTASPSDPNDVDTGGWPWDPEMHASTKGKTKDGYWRMKVGVSRPADKPGFPLTDAGSTSIESTGVAESLPSTDAAAPAAGPVEEDDEFAAFRKAAEASDMNETVAAAAVPARKWTDADLSALCNQAAVKLGDPTPVKTIIAQFVPEGEVQHSRMVPDDKRAAFAAAIEEKAGIEFAG